MVNLIFNNGFVEHQALKAPGKVTTGFNTLTGTQRSRCLTKVSMNELTEPGSVSVSKNQISLRRLTY